MHLTNMDLWGNDSFMIGSGLWASHLGSGGQLEVHEVRGA